MINSYVCIDIETTGLNPKSDKIIEIGAIKIIDGIKVDTFSTLIYPGRTIDKHITTITGISNDDVKDMPTIQEVLDPLEVFLEEYPLLGHHIIFDFSFLKKAMINNKKNFEKKGIDTLRIARRFLPDIEKRTLEYLCLHYQIPHIAHRAVEDAEATCALYKKLVEDFYNEEETVFRVSQLNYQVKKESPITKLQKERLYELIHHYEMNVDYDVESLTRNEASRYTDKIYAKFGRLENQTKR